MKKDWLTTLNPTQKIEKGNFPFKKYLKISLVINLGAIFLILAFQYFLPPQVPLLYGLAEGEDQLVPKILLILPNSFSLLILIFNLMLANTGQKNEFSRKVLVFVPIVTTILATITTLRIFFLVGNFL